MNTDHYREDSGHGRLITVSAVILDDGTGRWLTVRKRGTAAFMHPGGKPEPGEDARAAAVREVAEELRLALDPDAVEYLGRIDTDAANEPGDALRAEVFRAPLPGEPVAAAEIEELRWIDPRPLATQGSTREPGRAPLLYDCAQRWPPAGAAG